MQPINLRDYELLAEARMDSGAWDYYRGGSGDEVTLQANCAAYRRIQLRPRVLVDVSSCSLSDDGSGHADQHADHGRANGLPVPGLPGGRVRHGASGWRGKDADGGQHHGDPYLGRDCG